MNNKIYLEKSSPMVRDFLKLSFPEYKGKKFKIIVIQGPVHLDDYMSGGTWKDWIFLHIETMKTIASPLRNPMEKSTHEPVTIPKGVMGIAHSYFCGKDMGIEFHVHPENMNNELLPSGSETAQLSKEEMAVLTASKCFKSSFRLQELQRYCPAMTKASYDAIREQLRQKGYLDARGAITPSGRNIALSQMHLINEYGKGR